jgi:hypothetical protein
VFLPAAWLSAARAQSAVRELFAFATACLSAPDYMIGASNARPTDGFAVDRTARIG